MPPPYVTKARFDGSKLHFTLKVEDFSPDDLIEVTGAATQSSGAFALIDQVVPARDENSSTNDSVEIKAIPGPDKGFRRDEDVTVFVRAARVWVTVLGEASGQEGEMRWEVKHFTELYRHHIADDSKQQGQRPQDATKND